MKINNDLFVNYLSCKYKAYLTLKGEKEEMSDYGLLQSKRQQAYKFTASSTLIRDNKQSFIAPNSPLTKSDLVKNSQLFIIGAVIIHGDVTFHFDALKQVPGKSLLGSFHYVPILFSENATIQKQQEMLLSLGSLVLGHIQGAYTTFGFIAFGNECKFTKVYVQKYRLKIEQNIRDLLAILNNAIPKLILNKHCRICQYEKRCFDQAKIEDNLSLLSGMGENSIRKLNRKGIFTVNQLSYTFRLRRINKRVKTQQLPYYFSLKALAIREQKVYVFQRPNIQNASRQVFVDMEGNANGSWIYLIGLLVVENGKQTSFSFWADTPALEKEIFAKFLALMSDYGNAHLFFYGSYESRVLKRMLPLVSSNTVEDLLLNRSINVLSMIHSYLYFPTYTNELKDIGKYLGCRWSDPDSSGLQSIVWRAQWEISHDNMLKSTLIRYNQEDCAALKTITEFIYRLPDGSNPKTICSPSQEVAFVGEIEQDQETNRRWGKKATPLEEYNDIIRCAYFDYQRDKIYVRTNRSMRSIHNREKRRKRKPSYRINKRIEFKSHKCPYCKSKNVFRDTYNYHAKHSFDLHFFAGGIKRWVTRYRAAFHKCLDCEKHFVPRRYKKREPFGHNLMAWAMQQHVCNRITFEHLSKTAQDCFGLPISFQKIHEFKFALAEYYKITYEKLLKKLLGGKILHADETTVKLKQDAGYVWVFANIEEVVYIYRPTRKTDFLHELFKDFQGVLITDFYTGYDSLDCPQQKCLVHLIRDVNDDLLKNPFDEELKSMAGMFSSLLKPIIRTIDKFGLKSRYMKKHKKDVKKYFDELSAKAFTSEVAEKLRQRMLKYHSKLFVFLDYDGVPWNNNNGEHAIKPFAKYRRLVNGRITEEGLNDYLILLSLYETCEYKGIKFLDFLLSKERDIDKFCDTY